MREENKHQHPSNPPPPPHYGTFEGGSNYPPPPQGVGFPQPMPPPGAADPPPQYYAGGYQTVPGIPVTERARGYDDRLPCCGIGFGWFMFIIGFFLGGIPWYVGMCLMACGRPDPREKPGYVACVIAGILEIIAIVFGVTMR